MDLREIYNLIENAEKGVKLLEAEADSYKNDLEDFYCTESIESGYSHTRVVSKEMLKEKTCKIAKTVSEHQNMVERVETALSELEDYSNFRYIQGEKVNTDEMEERAEEIVDDYNNTLEAIWNTGFRIKQDEKIEVDPIEARYNIWKKEIKRSSSDSPEILGELFS